MKLLAKRIPYLIGVLFAVSLVTFLMQELLPGDPAVNLLGAEATPEQIAQLRTELGLEEPFVERYTDWVTGAVRGDFGNSLVPPVRDVGDMIGAALPVTLELAVLAMIMSLLLSVPTALYSAYRAEGSFDRVASRVAFGLISLPNFLAALLLIYVAVSHPSVFRWAVAFACVGVAGVLGVRAVRRKIDGGDRSTVKLSVGVGLACVVAAIGVGLALSLPDFPRQGFSRLGSGGIGENLRHVFLPALTIALAEAAVFMRLLRADLMSTLQEDFVQFARAKGMPAWRILISDTLRPSSFSLVTVAGVALGRLIGGTVIVESIFNLPGMGTMIVKAIGAGDFRVVQAGVLVIAAFYVVINMLIELLYVYLDPRMRRHA